MIGEYKRLAEVSPSGGTYGSSSLITLVPEVDLGLVVLANGLGGNFLISLAQSRLLQLVCGQPPAGEASMAPSIGEDRDT